MLWYQRTYKDYELTHERVIDDVKVISLLSQLLIFAEAGEAIHLSVTEYNENRFPIGYTIHRASNKEDLENNRNVITTVFSVKPYSITDEGFETFSATNKNN